MKFTNNLGLPEPLVRAVTSHTHEIGESDISVTQLIGPARKRVLETRHASDLEEDVADRIWALMGSVSHAILQSHAEGLSEERMTYPCLGWNVSGQVDLIERNQIIDYKTTSVWSVLDGVKPEWTEQLNCYRVLAAHNGLDIQSLVIVAILRDWSVREAQRGGNYPAQQVLKLNVPLWTIEQARAFMEERVKAHQEAQKQLPECSESERWFKPAKYALMKKGNIRASKVCNTMEEAQKLKTADQVIEVRPGENVRCENYCSVAQFCDFFKSLKGELAV